jgi:hypothetical protein
MYNVKRFCTCELFLALLTWQRLNKSLTKHHTRRSDYTAQQLQDMNDNQSVCSLRRESWCWWLQFNCCTMVWLIALLSVVLYVVVLYIY